MVNLKSLNQTSTPLPRTQSGQQEPRQMVGARITTSSGSQYTLDKQEMDWIKSRYKQDGADTYGWDDADQYAKQTGQLSAKMRSTYKNSNVDRQLAEMGLPSEKNLEKYIAEYQNWHTGGISDHFSKDTPQDFYTKTKEMFKGDWQYDDTQEDQLRKKSGQMPSKLAAKYTDTEIDDELRAAGLPPFAEMNKYIDRYNNYSAIDNLYKNAAVEWANLGITKDKNGQYIQNDDKVYTMEDGSKHKGKDLYSEAFYNVMRRRDEKGGYVYGKIFGMFKNNHLEEYDPDDYDGTNYNQYLGKEFVNASKVADLADDYAAYTAFSYDDFAGKYGDYYNKYLKDYKFSDGQTLEDRMKTVALENDKDAKRKFYDVSNKWFDGDKGIYAFVERYKQAYPSNTYEQMFTDMFENGVSEYTIWKTMWDLRSDTNITGGKNRAEDKNSGHLDITDAFHNAKENYKKKQEEKLLAVPEAVPEDASTLTAFDAMQSIEQYMKQNGGWTADNATKAVEALQKAGASYDTIKGAVEEMQDLYGVEHNDVLTALVNASALTYNPNKAELEKIGNEFNALVNGNVDYNKRPIVLPEAMWQAGYTDFDKDDIATTYFTTLGVGEGDNLYTVLATPILNDGTVLSKQELEDYVSSLDTSNGIKGLLASDKYGIVVNTRQGDYDPEYWEPLIDKLGEIKEQHTDLALPLEFSERTLPQFQKMMRASMDENMKLASEDEATIETAYEAIDKMLTNLTTTDEGVASVNDVIAVLNAIESASWNNPVAMEKALERYGFKSSDRFTGFTGLAKTLTKNWSKEDKLKLAHSIGSTRTIDLGPEYDDFTKKLIEYFGDADATVDGETPRPKHALPGQPTTRDLRYYEFEYALDWAKEQIANGTLTDAQAYQVLSSEGFSPELEEYVGKDWHEAIYKELMVPQLVKQAGGAQLATWEEMTPEEQQAMATSMFNNLTDEQYAQLFGDWKSNPYVYRTFGQAFEQQFAALIPSLANNLVAGGVKLGDMIGAAITGRPELKENTQKFMGMQEFTQNFGSVYDDVNGAKMADVMANVTEEIIRMYTLGTIGAGVGAGFEATGVGSKIAQLATSDTWVVKKATNMALSLVKSSPFVASAWAQDYAEWKQMGASNGVAMWNSMITGMSEGILEGLNFDNLWGKVLGQERFATQILDAGKNAFKTAGIVWKARVASMAASGLGEWTEESIGYVIESWRKSRYKELWGDVKLDAGEWLEQAGMGFLVGLIGGGISSMNINSTRILTEYAASSKEALRAVFPDVATADGIWGKANETVKAAYRTGGATILSTDVYQKLDEQAETLVSTEQKVFEQIRADRAKADEKINNAEAEVRKIEDKAAKYQGRQLTGKESLELSELWDKWVEAKLHVEAVRNNVNKDLEEKMGEHERSLQNAESQLKDLQKKIQEHFCGIYLMNEGATPEQAFENMMNAYQNGFKVEGKAAQAVETPTENATETNATAETSKDEASVAAREAAYDRVYTDQEAGKAYGNETKNAKGSKLTRVEFAENERQNFQAKTTAKQGKVTLELAGLEAAEGMSDKEIIAEAKKAMTPDAAKKLDMFMKLSKALGMPMVIRDVVAGTSGYVHDGKLYVTLNGKQALLRVTAHEVTHWMKEHLPSGYDVLRTRLINDVGGQEAFDDLVQKKAQEYSLDLSTEKGRLEADDEVCAELCEKMFENKDALEKFVNESPEAAKTLKARLAKTLVAIKQAIKSLGTSSSKTNGDLIKDQDTIELWYKTLSEAIDAANAEAKGKVQPTIEDVATETETSTEAQPQAPPAPEGVEELGISSEEVRKQNLRSELEELAKKGTKVKDFDRASVNEILDRVIVGDRTNYSKADYAQIRGMLAQLIPEIKAMVDGDTSVDLDALNERVQTALNYMLDRYSEPSAELYDLREIIPGKIALTETAYDELRKNSQMTLKEASNRMTRALGKFVNFVYKGSPNYSAASTIDEVWRDIGHDPDGQGNIAEDADALIKYVEERAERSSYDDLYKSQREDVVSAHTGEFLDAVQSAVEGKNAETKALHKIDDDYMPLAELYAAGVATEEETDRLRNIVAFAASQAGYEREAYHGTRSAPFTVFDRNLSGQNYGGYNAAGGGFDFTDTEGWARRWGAKANGNGDVRTVHVYLNTGKPFYSYDGAVDPSLEKYLPYTMTETEKENAMKSGAAFHKALEDNGVDFYDVMMREGYGSYSMYDGADNVSVYNPSQIKSADLVTRDDNGNIIPLSERFRTDRTGDESWKNKDIRYSIDDDYMPLAEKYDAGIATEEETEELRKDVDEAARENGYSTTQYYHGTPFQFNSFDRGQSKANNDFGPGIYLTNNELNAVGYSGKGGVVNADLLESVGSYAESVADGKYDYKTQHYDWIHEYNRAFEERLDELQEQGRVIPLYAKVSNPFTVSTSDYIPAEEAERIIMKSDASDADKVSFLKAVSALQNENGMIRTSDFANGDFSTYLANALEKLGYDGIVDKTAAVKHGQPYGTEHLVVFDARNVKESSLITYDDDNNIIPLSERFNPNKTDIRWTVDNDWDEAVRRYGAKPQGMNPRARDVQVPERLNSQSRNSDFLRSLVESGKVTAEQVEMIKKMVVEQNYMSYIPTSVSERMEQARKYIAQRQPLQAQQEFHDMVTEGKGGANTVALGIQLLSDAAERGDIESVLDTAADLQILATDSGQSVQAFSVLKQLKGVGSAWYMQKLVDRLNSKYADRIAAGKMDTITVSPELMAQLAAATNVNEIEAAEEAVAKEIAGQLPLTWTDRLSNWRYFSMLANPVTHFRNIFGNVLMGGMNMAKDVVATGLERTLNVAEEDRAHAVLTAEDRKTWGDWAQKSYDENARNLRGGGKLGFETFVKQNMRSFDTKFLNALAKFNFDKLEGEDIRFIRPAYKNALMQYMKAQGYTLNAQGKVGKYAADGTFTPISNAKMTEAEEWASNQAWKATFRDASDLATMLNKVSKMNSVSRLLVEGVMPFKKTPINIAKRGIEYSPAGIVMGVAQLTNGVKKGKYTPAQAIDTLASGITGSALMALGVFLAKLGVIRGGGEDKKKYETYLEDTGDQTYAFKIGDVSINMSSIAPATIPLFMGVALEEMLNRQGDSFDLSTFTDTIAGTLNPLMEMSFMSSLNSALQNYNNNGIGGALGNTVLTAAQNYGSQYLPTAVARLGQLADPVQRTTKSSATSPIGGNMDYYVRSLAKKVPGATTALEPDVNVWGQTNTKDTFGEWLLDVANKFVLPTNVKITNRDAVDKELIRLVESTGGVDFLPSDGNKYFTVSGQTYKMNARQYTEFSKERGEASYAAIKEVMNSPAYVNANDTQRADMLEKALKAAQKQVNTNWKYKLGAFD